MKIVKALEESGLKRKRISEKVNMKLKNEKSDFFQCY